MVDLTFGYRRGEGHAGARFNDFATGKRHGLEEINILNLDGTLNENGGPFAGMDRVKARKAVKERLARARARARRASRTC